MKFDLMSFDFVCCFLILCFNVAVFWVFNVAFNVAVLSLGFLFVSFLHSLSTGTLVSAASFCRVAPSFTQKGANHGRVSEKDRTSTCPHF